MNKLITLIILLISIPAFSALPVLPVPAEDQAALLESDSAELAANKRLVYDLWRTLWARTTGKAGRCSPISSAIAYSSWGMICS